MGTSYFVLPAHDLQRAEAFYARVLGWSLVSWGQGHFCMLHSKAGEDIAPSLAMSTSTPEAAQVFGLVVVVPDLEALVATVEANGGTIKQRVPAMDGSDACVQFADSEGNLVWAAGQVGLSVRGGSRGAGSPF